MLLASLCVKVMVTMVFQFGRTSTSLLSKSLIQLHNIILNWLYLPNSYIRYLIFVESYSCNVIRRVSSFDDWALISSIIFLHSGRVRLTDYNRCQS
jgi:hypothetical protein